MAVKAKITRNARREELEFYICISPWLIGFLILVAGPFLASLALSFLNWSMLSPPKVAWGRNYVRLLTDDPLFWQSLKVTFLYSLGIPLRLVFALLIALLMNQKIRGVAFFRTIYYLPAVVSGVAVALLWSWIFNPEFGVLNWLLSKIGIPGPQWLFSEVWVIPAFILMSLWGVGGSMVIFLAGLQGVPQVLYEASEIDGANSWQKLWNVTVPMISPVIFFNLIMGIIQSFQVFTQVYVMTGGGPNNASLFYLLYLYRNAFEYFKMGYASALAWVLFLIILGCTLLVFKSSPLWVYYEGEVKGRG